MATLELDGWGNGYAPPEVEPIEDEIDPIDEVIGEVEELKYILKLTNQLYYLKRMEEIENKLITIFQI